MWIATKYGFYSIVKSDINDDYLVRARANKDLVNLKKKLPFLKNRKVHEFHLSDYQYRIFIKKGELVELFEFLSDNIDYSNFKNKILNIKNQRDKLDSYHEIWESMYDYQVKSNFNRVKFYKNVASKKSKIKQL